MPIEINPNKTCSCFTLFPGFLCAFNTFSNESKKKSVFPGIWSAFNAFLKESIIEPSCFPGFLACGVRGATTQSLLATLYRCFPHESPAILQAYGAHYIVRSSLLDPVTLSEKSLVL